MASTAVQRVSSGDNSATGGWTSDSISTWTDGSLGLVAVMAIVDGAPAPGDGGTSLSGNGQTWTSVANGTSSDGFTSSWRLQLWEADALSSPSTGVLTAGFTTTAPTEVLFKAMEIDEVPGAGASVVQASSVATGNSTSPATSLSAFADATNNVTALFVSCFIDGTLPTISFGTLTELGADQQGVSNGIALAHAWGTGEDTSPDATLSSATYWTAISVEVDNDAGAGVSVVPIIMAHHG